MRACLPYEGAARVCSDVSEKSALGCSGGARMQCRVHVNAGWECTNAVGSARTAWRVRALREPCRHTQRPIDQPEDARRVDAQRGALVDGELGGDCVRVLRKAGERVTVVPRIALGGAPIVGDDGRLLSGLLEDVRHVAAHLQV
jgi:hypothetical protein